MKKIIAIIGIIFAMTALVLLGTGHISAITFWIVTGGLFVVTYFVLPKLND